MKLKLGIDKASQFSVPPSREASIFARLRRDETVDKYFLTVIRRRRSSERGAASEDLKEEQVLNARNGR
jgi:hypothetical protein